MPAVWHAAPRAGDPGQLVAVDDEHVPVDVGQYASREQSRHPPAEHDGMISDVIIHGCRLSIIHRA
jgi:hypothetical protein